MTIKETPTFTCTLVSAELSTAWTEHSVMQNVQQQDPELSKAISGVQLNNQGRNIEFLITSPNDRERLLSKGLKFGNETIMFRPYNGVFALLKNVPLEINREGVLQLVQSLGWQINGPSPASRICPQHSILRDGRAILSGRWTCMLDKFPDIPKDGSGARQFYTKAYGGRKITYNVSFQRYPQQKVLGQDPNNYTRKISSAETGISTTPQHEKPTTVTKSCQTSDTEEVPSNDSAPHHNPETTPEPQSQQDNKKVKSSKKKNKTSSKSLTRVSQTKTKQMPSHPGNPPTKPVTECPFEQVSDTELSDTEPETIKSLPSNTIKIQVFGFSTSEPMKLLQDLQIDNLYTVSNYPPIEFTRHRNAKTDTAYICLPQPIADNLIAKSGNKFAGQKLIIKRITSKTTKRHLTGLVIKNLDTEITQKDVVQALQFEYEPSDYNKMTHFALSFNEETHTRTFSYQVPIHQFQWLARPLTINGDIFQVTRAYNNPTSPHNPNTHKSSNQENLIQISNSFDIFNRDQQQETEFELACPTEQLFNIEENLLIPIDQQNAEEEAEDMEIPLANPENDHTHEDQGNTSPIIINNIINNVKQIDNTTIVVQSPTGENHVNHYTSPKSGQEQFPFTNWEEYPDANDSSTLGVGLDTAFRATTDPMEFIELDDNLPQATQAGQLFANLSFNPLDPATNATSCRALVPYSPTQSIPETDHRMVKLDPLCFGDYQTEIDFLDGITTLSKEDPPASVEDNSTSYDEINDTINKKNDNVNSSNYDNNNRMTEPSQTIIPSTFPNLNTKHSLIQTENQLLHTSNASTNNNPVYKSNDNPPPTNQAIENFANCPSHPSDAIEEATVCKALVLYSLTQTHTGTDHQATSTEKPDVEINVSSGVNTANHHKTDKDNTASINNTPLHNSNTDTINHIDDNTNNSNNQNNNQSAEPSPNIIPSTFPDIDVNDASNQTKTHYDSTKDNLLNDPESLILSPINRPQGTHIATIDPHSCLPSTTTNSNPQQHSETTHTSPTSTADSLYHSQTVQLLVDLNTDSELSDNIVSEDSDVTDSSKLVIDEFDHDENSQSARNNADCDIPPSEHSALHNRATYIQRFVKANSPLHIDAQHLKRQLSSDEEVLQHKKSKAPEVPDVHPPKININILDNSSSTPPSPMPLPVPYIPAPPEIPVQREFISHGTHQFPISLNAIQKQKQLFWEQNPVAIEQILDMIVISNYDFTSLINDPMHQTEATELDKNRVTSKLLYLLVGQDRNLISSWPSQLPPLPEDIAEQWQKLCDNRRFPSHHESVSKLVSNIHKVTLKTVEHAEIEEEIQRMSQKLKIKTVK